MEEKKFENGCGCKPLKGIRCDVRNCYYHDCETDCTAKEIAVGPHDATTSDATLCATFRPKSE